MNWHQIWFEFNAIHNPAKLLLIHSRGIKLLIRYSIKRNWVRFFLFRSLVFCFGVHDYDQKTSFVIVFNDVSIESHQYHTLRLGGHRRHRYRRKYSHTRFLFKSALYFCLFCCLQLLIFTINTRLIQAKRTYLSSAAWRQYLNMNRPTHGQANINHCRWNSQFVFGNYALHVCTFDYRLPRDIW